MTREYYLEHVDTFDELIDFCAENDLRDYLSVYTYHEMMDEFIDDMRDCSLSDILYILKDINEPDAEYFYYEDTWRSLTPYDFREHKAAILSYCDDVGYIFEGVKPSGEIAEEENKYSEIDSDEFLKLIA